VKSDIPENYEAWLENFDRAIEEIRRQMGAPPKAPETSILVIWSGWGDRPVPSTERLQAVMKEHREYFIGWNLNVLPFYMTPEIFDEWEKGKENKE
jgi:hypothetical protein